MIEGRTFRTVRPRAPLLRAADGAGVVRALRLDSGPSAPWTRTLTTSPAPATHDTGRAGARASGHAAAPCGARLPNSGPPTHERPRSLIDPRAPSISLMAVRFWQPERASPRAFTGLLQARCRRGVLGEEAREAGRAACQQESHRGQRSIMRRLPGARTRPGHPRKAARAVV